ncbi:hypothetical protein AAG570_001167 [Ranatra chinensis]|uniref:Peptidase S1 domain-containing protein n=1 Tax=Ranatra chinensis TaxID=642074 RepID=A0ABD0YB33_9HEMI
MGPYGEVTDPPTTPEPTTQKSILPAYLSIESEEIDSSEHGGPPGRVPTTCPCGTANKQLNKIIGGEEAGVNEFPFAVMLTIKGRYAPFCGGSIITARHVITAAHCVVGLRDWVTIAVRMGDHNFNEENAPHSKTVDVSEIIVHEKYSEHHNYDIALLVLNETIKFNRFVFPVCIPAKQLSLDRQYLKAMGWGRTGWTKENGLSIYLKKMNVRAVPLSECARFTSADASDPHQLCTYGKRRGLGKGDSGGPVVWLDKDTNRYTIVGLPSFVYPFLTQNYKPDVTADVSSFLPWIHEKLKSKSIKCNTVINSNCAS